MEETKTIHSIDALCERSHAISVEKGWVKPGSNDPRPFSTSVALMHSELSEALEDWRSHYKVDQKYYEYSNDGVKMLLEGAELERIRTPHPELVKPCGIPIELADLVIRICQRVGTDGNGAELHNEVTRLLGTFGNALGDEPDFEKFIAERHLDLSKAYEYEGEATARLAIVVANTFVYCDRNKVDLWAAIDEKEAYNRTRPARHGGKKC